MNRVGLKCYYSFFAIIVIYIFSLAECSLALDSDSDLVSDFIALSKAVENTVVPQVKPQIGTQAQLVTPSTLQGQEEVPVKVSPLPTNPEVTGLQKKMNDFIESQRAQKFLGKSINLQVRDLPVTDVLRMLGEYSGFNLVISDEVKGNITLSLKDVPWDQALDLVLKTQRLGAERNNNVLRVLPLKTLKEEQDEEQKVRQAALEVTPLVTRVFPISYAILADLTDTLNKVISSTHGQSGSTMSSTAQAGQNGSLKRSFVQADNRTNSLIVRDTEENVEKMQKLIELLDRQIPQIMIEAKIVEATEGFSKSLNGNLGLSNTNSSSQWLGAFAGSDPIDPLLGSPGLFSAGSDIQSATSSTNAALGGISLDFIPGVNRLNAILQIGETENQVKIISAPKTVVVNREKANIVQGTPVLVPQTTTVAGVGTSLSNTVQQANISLGVEPSVTNDGSVMMKLNVSKDIPVSLAGGQQGIGSRNITTQVLVDSGATLVIGGIFTVQSNFTAQGVPFFRSIPIIGALFGTEQSSEDRSELLIFITPRIINLKDTGING